MKKEKRDRLEMDGVVQDTSKGKFTVEITDLHKVKCTLSGKIRQNAVRILVGDRVRVELSQYDTLQGRIVYRFG